MNINYYFCFLLDHCSSLSGGALVPIVPIAWAYEQTFFPSAKFFFLFSNPNPFPFEPKETKIREDNFSEMKEREESSSIFVVGERIYNVKFNMNAQTWLLNHY